MKFTTKLFSLLSMTFAVFFTSCSAKTYELTYLTNTNVNVQADDITLITSQKELTDYKDSSRFSNAETNVIEKMESYSSEFFDKKMLIVINLQESSGSFKVSVEKVDYKDCEATIILKRKVPNVGDDSLKVWSIFIEDNIQEINSVKYSFQ